MPRIMQIDERQLARLTGRGHQPALVMQAQIVTKPVDRASHRFMGARRHRSEQYFTASQFLAHDLRQTISRPQRAQSFLGKAALLPRKLSLPEVFVNADPLLPIRAVL